MKGLQAWEEKQEIFKSWYSGCQLCSKVDQLYYSTWHKSIGHDLPSFFSEAVVPTPCEQLLPAITKHSNGYIFYYLTSILIFCRYLGNLKPYVARDMAHTFITWTSSECECVRWMNIDYKYYMLFLWALTHYFRLQSRSFTSLSAPKNSSLFVSFSLHFQLTKMTRMSGFLGFFVCLLFLVGLSSASSKFEDLFQPSWANDHFIREGELLRLKLDNYSGN